MEKSPMEVFHEFGQGLMSGTNSWKNLVAGNITFTGPVNTTEGLEAFTKLNENFIPMIRKTELKQAVEFGNHVITQVVMHIALPSEKIIELDMTEWYNIQNGKIQNIKIYYDAEEFRKGINT